MKSLFKTALVGLALSASLHAALLLAAEPAATWKNVPTQTLTADFVRSALKLLAR